MNHGERVRGVNRIATRLLALALSGAAAACLPALGVASGSTAADLSPLAVYSGSLAAGNAQRSVHWTSHAAGGGAAVTMTCDVTRSAGIQRISYSGGGHRGKATVMVIGGDAYLRGDAFTLTAFMGFKGPAALKYANVWVEVPRSDRHFAAVAAGVVLRSAIAQVEMVAPFRALAPTVVNGQRALAVAGDTSGSQPVPVVLYVRATAPHLPLGAVSKSPGYATSIFFSRWNEPVGVSKPAHAVSIAQTGL